MKRKSHLQFPIARLSTLCVIVVLQLTAFLAGDAHAQDARSATNHFAIEDLTSGMAVRRGSVAMERIPQSELILSPLTKYRIWRHNGSSGLVGTLEFTTAPAGRQFEIPAVPMRRTLTGDRDADGLSDEIEFILGTSPNAADTDQGRTPDGPDIKQRTDPLDRLQAQTGVIDAVNAEGTALYVAAVPSARRKAS